jgi:cyclopropane fatty-acyl-phospholipid synthase-like methyltransferase
LAPDNENHENEYPDSTVAMLELIWGEGFMSPGGEAHVMQMAEGIELAGRRVLDIGSGLGGPACILAQKCGAHVVGIDLEPPLVERAVRRAATLGVSDRVDFSVVAAGDLPFGAESFDLVMSSGGVTQTADKPRLFRDCRRVLCPGGHLSLYDWMKREGDYSQDMLHWFDTEGLTYAMETAERQDAMLREAGFEEVRVTDRSEVYRGRVREEYEWLRADGLPPLTEILGETRATAAIENWRATVVVCEKGEMRQVYSRARRPM